MDATEQSRLPVPEQGMMGPREVPFAAQPVAAAAAVVQNMRLAFASDGTAVYKPDVSASTLIQQQAVSFVGDAGVNSGSVKKKRGRPRKYGPDGSVALELPPISTAGAAGVPAAVASTSPDGYPLATTTPTSTPFGKRPRGRPRGSGKKQQLTALGSLGIGFTPHVITVKAGEDVASSIMSFSQQGPRAVCILSANGAVSNVTLRQPATSGGTVTYEGRFEILSLSGSFLLSESGGTRSRTGGLSISLADPDGRVLGGGVAGLLVAASPIQVVLGSFINADYKKPEPRVIKDFPGSTKQPSAAAVAGSPPSRGTLSESSGGGQPTSPANQNAVPAYNNSQPGIVNMPWK